MFKTEVIVVAAGRGARLGMKNPKAFVRLGKFVILYYSLARFNSHPEVSSIILVVKKGYEAAAANIVKRERFSKVKVVISGGRRRVDSVFNGLKHISPDAKNILIHDAARPFVSHTLISRVINGLKKYKAVIPAIEIKDAVKEVSRNSFVDRTLKREKLRLAQTPQGFCRDAVEGMFSKTNGIVYDEAFLLESRVRVKVVLGEPENFKITTLWDLKLAQKII